MKARAIASLTLVGTLTVALLIVLGNRAEAKERFLDDFRQTYPAAAGTRLDGCSLCHFTNSDGKWDENQFADEYEEADKSFPAIQSFDTDGDGFTNYQEIQAGTFPGDASDNPNTYVPPPTGSGAAIFEANCAGCHGSNGGNLVPTSLSLSQLVEITTGGRGNMPAFSGTLSSADIQLVSEFLFSGNGAPTTTTTTVPGFVPDGATVWAGSCAGCHGAAGGNLVGRGLSATRVVSVTTSGTTGMPGFSSSLSAAQIDAVAAYVAAIGGTAPTTTTTAPGSPPPSGSAVFAQSCAGCHGAGGGNLVGHLLTDAQLRSVTVNGRGSMSGFGNRLSSAQIDAVVAYLSSLGGSSTTSDTGGADGTSLYATYCSMCHGAQGEGGSGGAVAGTTLTRPDVITLTTNGGASMPAFSDRLAPEQIAAIADFVLSLSGSDAILAGGGHTYATLCASCHGPAGEGGIGGKLIGEDISAAELGALIRNGTYGMPGHPDLTDDEMSALVDETRSIINGALASAEGGEVVAAGEDDGRTLSLVLDDEATPEEGPSLLVVALLGLIAFGVVGGIGFFWWRSAQGPAR